MSKIKEKKLNSIKSEMEEIKKFIVSSNDLGNSEQNEINYSNNSDEDTLTLTKIVNRENKLDNSKIEKEVKKEIIQLCAAFPIYEN